MSFYNYRFNNEPRLCRACKTKFIPETAIAKYCGESCRKKMRDKQIERRKAKLFLIGGQR